MIRRQLTACFLGLVMATCCAGMVRAADTERYIDDYSETTEGTTVWEDFFGYKQACGFDFSVDYNDTTIIHYFADREIIKFLLRDTYTNLESGFSFEDFASYTIKYDYDTGLADHHGAFWRIRVPGKGMVILDVGGFLQNWNINEWWDILEGSLVGKNHDVNGEELPPVSYCDLMAQRFPN